MSLRRRLAKALNAHTPALAHDLRRAGGRLEPELALVSLLCDRRRTAVCVGGADGGWVREMARNSAATVVFESDQTRWPRLRKLAGEALRLESAWPCDHEGRIERRDSRGAAYRLELRTLDSLALGEVSLIRIEAGALARSVLDGAKATLAASRPCVLIAAGPAPDIAARLSTHGLEPAETGDGRLFVPAERTELRARLRR